jgi:SAM-dependent methyltransferase
MLVAILAAALLWSVLVEHGRQLTQGPGREGFVNKREFEVKKGSEIYDDFYVSVYDDLLFNSVKNKFEIGTIVNSTKPTEKSIILDIGSGTGHHVGGFQERGLRATGLDISPAMVAAAKRNYPDAAFRQGDALQGSLFPPSSFTHITCLYFTLYYMRDKRQFFSNCYTWLMPGGYLVLHLVDRSAFDPILPAGNPLAFINPQTYASERITRTTVEFDRESYSADFVLDERGDVATFTEVFRAPATGRIRKNEHTLHMPTQKSVIGDAREAGFIVVSQSEMKACRYEGQYMYVLQKPG